ncbi:M56 family metallopeptidase [uncultured Sphingomonas sp.]|uniref:M56 family metallopeptidase n=1 Tax=uncultured Sphingomonas sp. TaxID=158754 RepID=UPI0025F93F9B|nr:M56 family metallopeptidase [uncultured Sphingomonas sp.]
MSALLPGAPFLGWLIEALAASTLLMGLALLIRRPVREAFGPQIAYALWALPLLRLLLPPLPAGLRQAAATPLSQASETITIMVVGQGATAVAPAVAPMADDATIAWGPIIGGTLALLWGVGALGFLLWHLTSHTRFCRRLLGTAAHVEEMRGVRVIASDAAPGPLAFGVIRRYVAFPLDFADRYDADERELALEHEIGHHQRGDLIANWIALAVLALHWFNPVAWRAFRAFRADQELANDARVLAGRSAIDRHAYACAIVKAAHGGAVSAACHLHTIDDLKGRIRMLTTMPRSRRRLATGGVLMSAVALTGLGLTASGTSAAKAISGKVGDTIGVDLQAQPPAPPAPPVAPARPAPATAPDVAAIAAVPAPPPALEAPDAPAAPPVPAAPAKARRIVINTMQDGKVATFTSNADGHFDDAAIERMAADARSRAPEVSSRNCADGRDGGPRQLVVHTTNAGKRAMIVCTNRIEAAATAGAMASAHAAVVKRDALQTALASVTATRASIANNASIPPADRASALKDIDDALVELRNEMADIGKD